MDNQQYLPEMVASNGRTCVLPDVDEVHGFKSHAETSRFSIEITERTLTMAHVCGTQLRKELEEGNTLRPKQIELFYFPAVVQHVCSIVDRP